MPEQYHKYLINESTNRGSLKNYISQAQAARIRGVSPQAIADLIRRGRLKTVVVARRLLVLRSEVEAFIERPKTGRPSKNEVREKVRRPKREETGETTRQDYVSQAQAARIRGVSQSGIADLIRRGRLKTMNVAGNTLLHRSEVEAFIPQPRTGRPAIKKPNTKATPKKKSKK